jgi:hypothetical protein
MRPMVYVFIALALSATGYAILRGGRPERLMGATLLIAVAASIVAQKLSPVDFEGTNVPLLLIDLAFLLVSVIVALQANRIWPIWFAACIALLQLAHAMRALDPDLWPIAYAAMISILSYPPLLILAVGTWRHRRRVARHGSDADWSVRRASRGSA